MNNIHHYIGLDVHKKRISFVSKPQTGRCRKRGKCQPGSAWHELKFAERQPLAHFPDYSEEMGRPTESTIGN